MIDNNIYKVGIYLRLSKEDERNKESGSITNQRNIIKQYLNDHHLSCTKEYVDDGVSGTTFERKGFSSMIEDIEKQKINMVITKDLSRFGRNEGQQLRYLDYFYEKNIRYVSILDNVDTSDEYNTSNEMIPIQCFFNEKHVRDTSKKMRASVYTKRSQGYFLGKTAPYGYIKDPKNKYHLLIDEPASQVVKRIYQLFVNGKSICEISRILTKEDIPIPSEYKNLKVGKKSTAYGIWDNHTISDILTLPTYMGDLTQGRTKKISYKSKKVIRIKKDNWLICPNKCPAIIDKETFNLVQAIYNRNKNQGKNTQDILLKGLVYCKECGHTIGFRMQKVKTKTKGEIIRCYGYCNYWNKHKKYHLCTPHSLKYFELEKIILDDYQKMCQNNLDITKLKILLENNNQQIKMINEYDKQVNSLIADIKSNQRKIENLYNDKLESIIDLRMYKTMYSKINKEINTRKQKIKELKRIIDNLKKDNTSYQTSKIINDFLYQSKPNFQIISSIIDKIEIDEHKSVFIHYKCKSLK